MEVDFSPRQELEFIKLILWLWDQYDEDAAMRKGIGSLVRYVHHKDYPFAAYKSLDALCDYTSKGVGNHTHESDVDTASLKSARSAYENSIRAYFGEHGLEMTVADQPLITDVGYYILQLGWMRLEVLYSLYLVLRLFEEKISERTPELADIMERTLERLQVLEEENEWNKEHNAPNSDSSPVDEPSLKSFYEKYILPQYPLDMRDIHWKKTIGVAKDAYTYYFTTRGRSYILHWTADDTLSAFKPSPRYRLVPHSKDREFIELLFTDGTVTPGITGRFRLYDELRDLGQA